MDKVRQIVFHKGYFLEFFNEQPEKVKSKIEQVLFLVSVADRIPQKFLKHIEATRGLYEIRIEFGGNIYRIFCCLDEGKLVVLFNGFQKKSQKTPPKEIAKAVRIMEEYFGQKNKAKEHGNKRKKG